MSFSWRPLCRRARRLDSGLGMGELLLALGLASTFSFHCFASAARCSSACLSSCTFRSTSCSRSAIWASSLASSSFSSGKLSISARRSAIRRSRSSSSACVAAKLRAGVERGRLRRESCSSRTSRPEASTCSVSDERRPCSRVSEAFSSGAQARRRDSDATAAHRLAGRSRVVRRLPAGAWPEGQTRTRLRCSATVKLLELEDRRQVEERRPEDDEEHRREDEEYCREEHLDRRLHRLLLREQLTLQARVGRPGC